MTSSNFRVPQPSPTLAVDGTHNLQRMLHVAIRNATCITGRRPVILPIAKHSPFDLYANNDSSFCKWENPWHLVCEFSMSQLGSLKNASPSVVTCSMPRQNAHATGWRDFAKCYEIIPHVISTTDFGAERNDTFRAGNVGEARLTARAHRIENGAWEEAQTASGNQDIDKDTTVLSAQSSWVPRIFQGRKLFMRVFPYELQNIMHAFGEVRFCSLDVLEFMEDAVRHITQRVALGTLKRFKTDKLTVRGVSTCIRHDPRALHRLLFCLRRARQKGEDLHVVRPTHREWDSFLHYATIHGIRVGEFPSLKHLEHIPLVKVHIECNEKARSIFWRMLGKLFKVQHAQCTQAYLTDRQSRCPTEGVGGRLRIDLFREWLSLPEHVQMTEGSLHALGNLTREAVGIITQTALLLKHRNALIHSYERLLIDTLSFGIGAGVLVPLSALQTYELLKVLDEMDLAMDGEENMNFRDGLQQGALDVSLVREAFRQLDDPDSLGAHRPFWVGP